MEQEDAKTNKARCRCSDNVYFVCSFLFAFLGYLVSYNDVRDLVCGLATGPPASRPLALDPDLGNA